MRLLGLVIFFLFRIVAARSTSQGTGNHGHVASGAATDQAAEADTGQATENRADTAVMVGLHLGRHDLLDFPAANFCFARTAVACAHGGAGT
ncbi:hypothetical protein D9M73_249990 [compost metagenome]